MAQNSSPDYYNDEPSDAESSGLPTKKSGVGMVILIIGIMFIVGICVLGFLAALLLPALSKARSRAGKVKCSNNLKSIGIASILYSDERRLFPHMAAIKEENSKTQVCDIYRTLIQGKYIDNAEVYVCPNSDDFALISDDLSQLSDIKEWDWTGPKKPGLWAVKDPSNQSVFDNEHLSYTYRRKRLNSSTARSDDFIAADKLTLGIDDSGRGNHRDGYYVVYADGHSEFLPTGNRKLLEKLYKELRMKTDKHPH